MADADMQRVPVMPPGRSGGLSEEAVRRAAGTALRGTSEARRQRRLTAGTVAALQAAGFVRHFVPRRWGGGEGTFGDVFDASVAVGEGCASAAWCAVLWAAHGRFAALLPEEGQREIWGEGPDVRIAAVLKPSGSASRLPGGWLLQGEWEPASSVDHAHWVLLAAPEADGPGRPARVFAVPRSRVSVRDTWKATGLLATGGSTVVLDAALVPDGRSVSLATLLAGAGTAVRSRCHTAPAHLAGGLMFCAPAVGAARRALTVWIRWAGATAPDGVRPLDRPSVRERLARSSAEIEAAELMLRTAAGRADTEAITAEAIAANRRDAAVAADWLATAVDRLFRTGGSHLLDSEGELHRHWTDVLTIASHGALRLEAAAEAYAGALGTGGAGDA